MKIDHPKPLKITVLEAFRLRIEWSTGVTLDVDLESRIKKFKGLSHLRDPEVFRKAHIADGGISIEWEDSEFGADNVYAWSWEQKGEPSHEMFFGWMYRNGLTLDTAAEALGMSRRMIAYYQSGQKPIPKHVWLACIGWETLQSKAA